MYIGIDPGYNGAIVHIDENKEYVLSFPMPVGKVGKIKYVDPEKIKKNLLLAIEWGAKVVFVERIWTGKELVKQMGVIEAVVLSLGLDLCYVETKAWQMYCFAKLNSKNKELSYLWARNRYEEEILKKGGKVWYDICDAICIANTGAGAYQNLDEKVIKGLITQRKLGY